MHVSGSSSKLYTMQLLIFAASNRVQPQQTTGVMPAVPGDSRVLHSVAAQSSTITTGNFGLVTMLKI